MGKHRDHYVKTWQSEYFFMPIFQNMVKMPDLQYIQDALSYKFGKLQQVSSEPVSFALMDYYFDYDREDCWEAHQLTLYDIADFDLKLWNQTIITQFGDCQPDIEQFTSRCNYAIMASDGRADALPLLVRYQLIAEYADLLLELFPDCIGIYWPHSQRLVPREVFENGYWKSKNLHFLDGGLHIRSFPIDGTDEMLFDTLGLTSIGMPDYQCRCKDFQSSDIVEFLRNLVANAFQQGEVVADDDSVEGIDGNRWLCHCQDSMEKPVRIVLDISPGNNQANKVSDSINLLTAISGFLERLYRSF